MSAFPIAHVQEAGFVRAHSATDFLCELNSISLSVRWGRD